MQQDAIYMLHENTYAGSYYGGIARFSEERTSIESLFTAKNAKDQQTAEQIYQAEIDRWTEDRWRSVLENMGLI